MKTLKLTLIVLFIFVSVSGIAQINSWTGSGDGTSYNDPNNWSSGSTPSTLDTLIFDDVTVTVTNLPTGMSVILSGIKIINNSNIIFESGSNTVNFILQNLTVESGNIFKLSGTPVISISFTNANIEGILNTGENHQFISLGTLNFIGTAQVITANPGGFEAGIQGPYNSTNSFSIYYNGTSEQSTGLLNHSMPIGNIVVENSQNVIMDTNIQTDTLNLTEGNFDIDSYTLTISGKINYQNGNLAGNGASGLTISGSNNTDFQIDLSFDPNYNILNTLSVNRPDDIINIKSDLTVNNFLDLSNGKLRLYKTLFLPNTATINASQTNYILTELGAYVNKNITAGSTEIIPIGTENSYAPVEIHPFSSDDFSISVHDGIFSEGDYGTPFVHNNVNLRWEIYPATNTTFDLSLEWNTASEIGTIGPTCYISNFNGIDWSNSLISAVSNDVNFNTAGPVTFTGSSGFFGVFWGTNEFPTTSDNEVIT